MLAACIARGDTFRSYLGIDLSPNNVTFLRRRFTQENVAFVEGDAETIELGESVDTAISSLTFKHLFPSSIGARRQPVRARGDGGSQREAL